MKWIFFISLLLLMTFGCRKKQPEMGVGQNACDCIEEVSAEFDIEESFGVEGQVWHYYTKTDTANYNRNVRFSVLEKNANVTWYLGQETEVGDKAYRYFGENLKGQSLPVICVVKKKPNKKCFPNDDGYDSIVKYIHISPRADADTSYLLEGFFRVKEENSLDSIDMQIVFRKTTTQFLVIDFFNYDGNGGNYLNQLGSGYNYREIKIPMNGHQGRIYNALSGEVKIEIIGNASHIPSYRYTGRKL